jgi:hypothetical protein
MFLQSLPLFRAGGLHHKIILSPLLRYMVEPSCSDPGHITYSGTEDLCSAMTGALTDFERWIKDQAYMKRLKNYCVINPNQVMAKGSNKKQIKQFWKAGPVHMASAGYAKLAEGLLDSLDFHTPYQPNGGCGGQCSRSLCWPARTAGGCRHTARSS